MNNYIFSYLNWGTIYKIDLAPRQDSNNIAFIPLEFDGTINGMQKPQIFNFSRLSANIYELTDTIAVNGKLVSPRFNQ